MNIAVVGSLHGLLDKMYQDVLDWQKVNNAQIDLILCCGEFKSLRDSDDLKAMSGKEDQKDMG